MSKDLNFVLLLDCYGDLLTDHQRDIMNLYYCEDLSLSEIGRPLGITRQAVCTLIKRTESVLLNYENKLGFVRKILVLKGCFDNIRNSLDSIEDEEIRKLIVKNLDNATYIL